MCSCHSKQRAEERYLIEYFNPLAVLKDIWANRCELIKSDREKYSHIFLVRYNNKYMRVVTDFDVKYVKTVLPLKDDFNLINNLIQKLIKSDLRAV